MAWISGSTVSPTSGELVFVIDEDAQLPGPQNWEQLWQICEGNEPIVEASALSVSAQYTDSLAAGQFAQRPLGEPEYIGQHLKVEHPILRSSKTVRPEDIDPMSGCASYERLLTFALVNFDISDGGDAVATTQGCVGGNCDTIGIYLRTRGKNPSKEVLDGTFPNDIVRAICWHESRWRHFLPSGKPISNVNTNGTTDWGLMQINEASFEEQWNWKTNVARGIALLGEKQKQAVAYLNKHPQDVTQTMIENETIQRYNGGAYYKWDASSGSWQEQPPNNYVATIRSYITSRPWQK